MHSPRQGTEIEPQLTMRGHSAPITKLLYSPSRHLLYSASLDATVRVWSVPNPAHTPYAPYDNSRQKAVLEGHTDAVWDLALVRDETLLVSCGADGTVKVWDVSGPTPSLKLTWGYNGIGSDDETRPQEVVAATALEAIKTDLRTLAVAFRDGVIKLFDLDSGREVDKLQNTLSNGEGSAPFQSNHTHCVRRWRLYQPDQQARLAPDDAAVGLWSRRSLHPDIRRFDRYVRAA